MIFVQVWFIYNFLESLKHIKLIWFLHVAKIHEELFRSKIDFRYILFLKETCTRITNSGPSFSPFHIGCFKKDYHTIGMLFIVFLNTWSKKLPSWIEGFRSSLISCLFKQKLFYFFEKFLIQSHFFHGKYFLFLKGQLRCSKCTR